MQYAVVYLKLKTLIKHEMIQQNPEVSQKMHLGSSIHRDGQQTLLREDQVLSNIRMSF